MKRGLTSIARSGSFIRVVLIAIIMLAAPAASFAQIGVAISFGPPELPVYEQPLCPGDGYIWVPGYWAYDYDAGDYYWVPGTWVLAPEVGFLWTPGYWGWEGGGFIFHEGYWGPHVGFYGGINYGFGYFGHGYEGGRWDGGHFFYNTTINHVDIHVIHNVYNTRVEERVVTRVSYNGGEGGINERPTREEEAAAHDRHISPVRDQVQHVQAARTNTEFRASVNHGKPPVAATARPGEFNGRGVVAAKEGGRYNPPPRGGNNAARGNNPENTAARPSNPTHAKDLPPVERHVAPSTGNEKVDKKYQQQQDKLQAQQEKERQNLQQKQEQEHQRQAQQQANEARNQQMEQRHQQQTQQLQQKHTQQQQKLQEKQQPVHQSGSKPPKG